MPSSGIVGSFFYNADTNEQLNTIPVPPGENFDFDGLSSNTTYRIYVKTIDKAGNLSTASSTYEFTTLAGGPGGSPVSPTIAAGIDAIVDGVLHSGDDQTGVMVSIISPEGTYQKAYGTAGSRPLTTDDHFRIGSVTKTFTAQAVFMQCDAGNLSLEDTVDQYIAGIPNGHIITIRNLLEMQSGLANDQTNPQFEIQLGLAPSGPWTPDNTLAYLKKSPAVKPPGTVWDYNSGNTILLGYILKAITGRPIRNIILEDIVAPLGMTETTWPTGTSIQSPYCHGYCHNFFEALSGTIPIISSILVFLTGGDIVDQTIINPAFFDAAGAMTSTIGDLLKWGKELRDGTLISDTMKDARETISTTGPGSKIALGSVPAQNINYGMACFQVGSWFGHDGSIPGFSTACMYEPRSGSVIVTMENFQTAAIDAERLTFYNIARYLMPSSTSNADYLLPQDITLAGVAGGEAFGDFKTYVWQPPGDEDGKLDIAHKVPFILGKQVHMPLHIGLKGVPSAEAFGSPTVAPAVGGSTQTITLAGVASAEALGTLTVSGFASFYEENAAAVHLNQAPPAGATTLKLTLVGGGAAGTNGTSGTGTGTRAGGRGGGGGAGVPEFTIPVSALGSTFTTQRGLGGGTSGANGSRSLFSSGSIVIEADGGFGQSGGTASCTGLATVPYMYGGGNGGAAMANPTSGSVGDSVGGNAGAGGGSGGCNVSGAAYQGYDGGASATKSGGAHNASASGAGGVPTDATAGNGGAGGAGGSAGNNTSGAGGAGGHGGKYGGGGGGGGAYGTTGSNFGAGADGYLKLEWS